MDEKIKDISELDYERLKRYHLLLRLFEAEGVEEIVNEIKERIEKVKQKYAKD